IEMRRLAPLGLLLERLNALEEALRTGKAPAANSGTPAPTGGSSSGSGGATRGGSGYGGGGSSGGRIKSPASRASEPPTYEAKREASPLPADATTPLQPDSGASSLNTPQQQPAGSRASKASTADAPPWEEAPWEVASSAAAAAATTSPPLKLVPPPSPESKGQPADAPASNAPDTRQVLSDAPAKTETSAGGVVERIKTGLEDRRKPFLAIALEGARKVAVEGEELYVEFAPEARHLRDNLSKPESIKLLREVCASVCGREMGVRIVVRDKNEGDDEPQGSAPDAEADERRRLRELAENHPSVQQVLRAFHAEIVDVRRVDGGQK
ncbi:MAG TPA: hypothetical protein VER76_21275, partial [Pyrinomonadaceae bacterium]|nr:hypothetical protein [Pyrinomonadaceae bacterium]